MSECWIETVSGRRFDLLEPQAAAVCVEDIAHALAQLCRFTGHTQEFYSVAQHSVLASYAVPAEHALAALLHDAHEAYIGDISRPMKLALDEAWRRMEHSIEAVVRAAFGLPAELPACVKQADWSLLLGEKRDLMTGLAWDLKWKPEGAKEYEFEVDPWAIGWAKRMFLRRFHELTAGNGGGG